MRFHMDSTAKKTLCRIVAVLFMGGTIALAGLCNAAAAKVSAKATEPKGFQSPEEAAQALVDAAKNNDNKKLLAILGRAGEELISSGDAVADRQGRERFVRMYETKHRLSKEGAGMMAIEVGEEDWPFPIPIIKQGGRWRFDTRAGKEEILNRRIGQNELSAIQVCQAYVDAQREYSMKDRDGDGILEYAQKLVSEEGQKNGLYWNAGEGEETSPLGPFAARAHKEGYTRENTGDAPPPYHGYYYNILKRQGKSAPRGACDYLVHENMIGGFALVAYPARYGSSGIMTFIVNHDGVVYEKNLGKKTEAIARSIETFAPDKTWKKVK